MPHRKLRRRREKGSGSITFDKARNKYIARMPDTGIGAPLKKQFGTEVEAHAWLDQKLRDSAEGIATKDIPTLAQWLDHCHKNIWRVKPTTAEHDGDVIRVRIVPSLAASSWTSSNVRRKRSSSGYASLKKTTMHSTVSVMHSASCAAR